MQVGHADVTSACDGAVSCDALPLPGKPPPQRPTGLAQPHRSRGRRFFELVTARIASRPAPELAADPWIVRRVGQCQERLPLGTAAEAEPSRLQDRLQRRGHRIGCLEKGLPARGLGGAPDEPEGWMGEDLARRAGLAGLGLDVWTSGRQPPPLKLPQGERGGVSAGAEAKHKATPVNIQL